MGYVVELAMRRKQQARKRMQLICLPCNDEEEQEEGEPDLHQCGHCKLMFNNLKKYISHKLQKVCWNEENNDTPSPPQVTAWPPFHAPTDQNGSTSPDSSSPKEDFAEETEAKLQSVTSSTHTEIVKRKHRKGIVRRIKPVSDDHPTPPDYTSETEKDNIVVVTEEDDDTVFATDPTIQSTKQECDDENNDVDNDADDDDEYENRLEIVHTEDDVKNNNNNNVSRFSPSSFNKKTIEPPPPQSISGNIKTNRSDLSFNVFSTSVSQTQLSYSHKSPILTDGRFSSRYPPTEPNQKFDRIPSHLPQVMSTQFSPSNVYSEKAPKGYARNNVTEVDRYSQQRSPSYLAMHRKFATDYTRTKQHHLYHESEAKNLKHKTHGQMVNSKNNPDSYNSYDKYKDMASMVSAPRSSEIERTVDERRPPLGIETEIKKEETKLLSAEPPQLVRILSSQHRPSSDVENPSDSPPSLEKCPETGSPIAKTELDIGNEADLVSPSEEQNKFSSDRQSSDKGSNSPDSHHSNDDLTHESLAQGSPSLAQLPRVRQLSESTVERLITEPSSQSGDASWKHAKQVYRCPLCAKVFPFKSKLQRHVLVHTGIKPYKCTVCGRGFTQQIDLQRHLTRHTGEKPFKCHLCKAQFIRADNLRKHCKDAHYVNIEEPIRKRRRKATGSDTVLPPLEVAIALALSETERNGGRILGRAVTKSSGKTTTSRPSRSSGQPYSGGQTAKTDRTLVKIAPRPLDPRESYPPNYHPMQPPPTSYLSKSGEQSFPGYPPLREEANSYSPDAMHKSSGYSSNSPMRKREREQYRGPPPGHHLYSSPSGGSFYSDRGYKSRPTGRGSPYYAEHERFSRPMDDRRIVDQKSMMEIDSRGAAFSGKDSDYRSIPDYRARDSMREGYVSNRYSSDIHPDGPRFDKSRREHESSIHEIQRIRKSPHEIPSDYSSMDSRSHDEHLKYDRIYPRRQQYVDTPPSHIFDTQQQAKKLDSERAPQHESSKQFEQYYFSSSSNVRPLSPRYSSERLSPPQTLPPQQSLRVKESQSPQETLEVISPRQSEVLLDIGSPRKSSPGSVDVLSQEERISPRYPSDSSFKKYDNRSIDYAQQRPDQAFTEKKNERISPPIESTYTENESSEKVYFDEQETPIVTPSDAPNSNNCVS